MDVWKRSIYSRSFEGSIHVDDLLYLYEKIWTIAFLRFPEFKKIEPRFEIRAENGQGSELSLEEINDSFSPEEALAGCNFTLRLPSSANHEKNVSSITFSSDNRHSILITVEGTDETLVDATANTIIYKINPYVVAMNKERQSPTPHEERKPYAVITEDAKPYLGMNVYEAPAIKSRLSDKEKEQIEKDSRKSSKFIIIAILAFFLLAAIVLIFAALR